jgi:hypothetical protein
MRNDFHDSIRDYAEKLIGKISAYRNKQKEFEQISDQTQLTFKELEQIGLVAESYNIATSKYINYKSFEYGGVVVLAENLLSAKLNREAQSKERAEFNERRFKRQNEMRDTKPVELKLEYIQQAQI